MTAYDAVLFVSFGGPEKREDVIPFLENVLRGKNVPHERMLEVAEHYYHFDGVSPINQQCREIISDLENELQRRDLQLPIYWGNRNWEPYLPDALQRLKADGKKNVIAFFTSMYSSYSGCRQYRENLYDAMQIVGQDALCIDKLRMPYNHPLLIDILADALQHELESLESTVSEHAKVLFCAHSIPNAMADNCRYEEQLRETARLVAEKLQRSNWELVFQSRSGPPNQPWLAPDICDRIEELAAEECRAIVIHPIGFVSDHMEVLYDLDHEAKETCDVHGIVFRRAATASKDRRFAQLICELIEERMTPEQPKLAVGKFAANHDVCPSNCCMSGRPGSEGRPALCQQPCGVGKH